MIPVPIKLLSPHKVADSSVRTCGLYVLFYWEIYLKSLFLSLFSLTYSLSFTLRGLLVAYRIIYLSYFLIYSILAIPTLYQSKIILVSGYCLLLCCSMLWDAEPWGLILLDYLVDWLLVWFGNGRHCQIWMRARREQELAVRLFILFLSGGCILLTTAPTRRHSPFFTIPASPGCQHTLPFLISLA